MNTAVVIGVAFLAAPLGVLAPKALTLLVIVGGAAGAWMWFSAGRPRDGLPGPVALTLLALLVWGGLSALWSEYPGASAGLAARLVLLNAAGWMFLFAAGALGAGARAAVGTALVRGYGVAAVAVAVGLIYAWVAGDSLWGTYYHDPLTTLNGGAVTAALLLWPVMAVLWSRGRRRTAAVVALGLPVLLAFLSSGAAVLALGAAAAAFAVVWAGRTRGLMVVALILAAMTLSAPYLARVVTDHLGTSVSVRDTRLPFSAQHRLAMWDFVTERIAERPALGRGLDSARSMPQQDRRLLSNMELMPLHPHNAALQVWLELGLVGAGLAAGLVFLLFRVLAAAGTRAGMAVLAGAGTAYMAVGAVSYGVWQNWWIGAAWILAALAWIAVRDPAPEPGGKT